MFFYCRNPLYVYTTKVPRDLSSHNGRYQKSSTCLLQQQPTAQLNLMTELFKMASPWARATTVWVPFNFRKQGAKRCSEGADSLGRAEQNAHTLASSTHCFKPETEKQQQQQQASKLVHFLLTKYWLSSPILFFKLQMFFRTFPLRFSQFLKNYLQIFLNTHTKFLLS